MIDKLPLYILAVGAINILFPDAKVVVALRDPRDVCLSCLMQAFNLNEAMVHFLSFERATRFYEAVMDAWLSIEDALTLDYLVIRYEDTVADLEAQARRMLEHLELQWDSSVLNFHKRAKLREIATPSFAAVTERVHTRATRRWRHYRAQIQPSVNRLGRFITEFGYDEID